MILSTVFSEVGIDPQLVQGQLAVDVRAAQQGLRDGVGLVVDFLLHEGREAALFRRGGVPVDLVFLALGGGAVEVGDLHGVRR